MSHIILINPRFNVSYWGLEHALPIFGRKANVPLACLPLLAALTPAGHTVTIVDENVEPLDFDRLTRADIVGLTGMSVQRQRMREILAELKARGAFTVVGGPWVTVKEDYFGELADVIFVGEAEDTWPRFLAEWHDDRHAVRYEQERPTDMTRVPVPRYDLMPMRHYLFGSVQFTRGCPFQCEFCDIIVTFGRTPRLKTVEQAIAELEALVAAGVEMAFLVDDNFIGNKKAIRPILAAVAKWQRRRGYPLVLLTQASLDLAEDPELLAIMDEANIGIVFIGIESPNEASLRETKKLQNFRKAGTMVERVRRIQDAGMEVWCGMIVGFDHDDTSIFAAQRQFLAETHIMHAMVGMLTAIPKTPLYDRLAAEDRLDRDDAPLWGTNVVPAGMTREELREGYIRLMQELYEPAAYFGRFRAVYDARNFKPHGARLRWWRRHPWRWLKGTVRHAVAVVVLYRRLMRGVPDAALRSEYRRQIWSYLRRHPDPVRLFILVFKCATHYHYQRMTREMSQLDEPVVNTM